MEYEERAYEEERRGGERLRRERQAELDAARTAGVLAKRFTVYFRARDGHWKLEFPEGMTVSAEAAATAVTRIASKGFDAITNDDTGRLMFSADAVTL